MQDLLKKLGILVQFVQETKGRAHPGVFKLQTSLNRLNFPSVYIHTLPFKCVLLTGSSPLSPLCPLSVPFAVTFQELGMLSSEVPFLKTQKGQKPLWGQPGCLQAGICGSGVRGTPVASLGAGAGTWLMLSADAAAVPQERWEVLGQNCSGAASSGPVARVCFYFPGKIQNLGLSGGCNGP